MQPNDIGNENSVSQFSNKQEKPTVLNLGDILGLKSGEGKDIDYEIKGSEEIYRCYIGKKEVAK